MAISYHVRLYNTYNDLAAVLTLDDIIALDVKRKVNDVGSHGIMLKQSAIERVAGLDVNGRVEVWRHVDSTAMLEYGGLHLISEFTQDESGAETLMLAGVSYLDILRRRVIAAASGTSGAYKSGPAESVAKAFVTEQAVSPSVSARAIPNLVVEPDQYRGNTVSLSRAYRNLLEVLQEIAAIGRGDFDVLWDADAGRFVFTWYDGQMGADRRDEVVFSTAFGNMIAPRLTIRPDTANVCLVIGSGEGQSRAWVWVPSSDAYAGLARMEVVRDARDTDDEDVYVSRGLATLAEARGGMKLSFRVVQTPGSTYGVHYGLGDLVRMRYRDYVADAKITAVTIRVRDGREDIELEFEEL